MKGILKSILGNEAEMKLRYSNSFPIFGYPGELNSADWGDFLPVRTESAYSDEFLQIVDII